MRAEEIIGTEEAITCIKMMFAFWANTHEINVAAMEGAKDKAILALRSAHSHVNSPVNQSAREACVKCSGPCYFCLFNETRKCSECKDHNLYTSMFNFCPECGRPLKDKAQHEIGNGFGGTRT